MSRFFSVFNARLKSHYEVLGVPKNATQSDIKAAYYKLSKLYHPDKNQTDAAVEEFRSITEAYEVIGNYKMRKMYDRGLLGIRDESNTQRNYTVYHPSSNMNKPSFRYRSTAYNFDEWTQAHYGESFNRRTEAKTRYEEKMNHDRYRTSSSKNENVVVSVFSLLVAVFLFKIVAMDNLDEVNLRNNESNSSSRQS